MLVKARTVYPPIFNQLTFLEQIVLGGAIFPGMSTTALLWRE
jgi:hypothetical protein